MLISVSGVKHNSYQMLLTFWWTFGLWRLWFL